MAPPQVSTTINSTDEFKSLLESNKFVVTDFYADWCAPCKAIAPLYEQFASKHKVDGTVAFAKVDIETVPDLAEKYSVTTIPTFLFIRDGETYDDLRTVNPRELKAKVESIAAEVEKAKQAGEGEGKLEMDEDF